MKISKVINKKVKSAMIVAGFKSADSKA